MAQAVAVEAIDRFLDLHGDGRERRGLLGGLRPDVARIAEDAIQPQARRDRHGLGERCEGFGRRHTSPPHADVEIHEYPDRDPGRSGRR